MSSGTVDTLTGLIPVAVAGGMAVTMTERVMGQRQPLTRYKPRRRTKAKEKRSSKWNSLTRKEVVELIGQTKADLLKKNEGEEYQWGYDTFVYEDGSYYLA